MPSHGTVHPGCLLSPCLFNLPEGTALGPAQGFHPEPGQLA